jgi:predicted LPLAT superfamily acyltransferase
MADKSIIVDRGFIFEMSVKSTSGEWVAKAQGNSAGTRLFIWIISKIGIVPAYIVLLFAAAQYTLCDRKTKRVLKDFRMRLKLPSSVYHLYCHFYNFGMSLVDRYAYLLTQKQFFKFTVHKEDLIEQEVRAGKGVILLGAHFGNWELAGNLLQGRLNARVNFLMYDAESKAVKDAVAKATANRQVNIIFVGKNSTDTSIALINALHRGEIVCLHGDRVLGEQRSVIVSFMGYDVRFPAGPFILAAASGAPVIPIFAVKTGLLSYSFSAHDPIRFEHCSRHERQDLVDNAVKRYTILLEAMVRKYPLQWFNYYHFWG